MNEHPIIFNGDMVRAILDGRKTQTRRVIKPQPELGKPWRWWVVDPLEMDIPIALCPYGVPGDRLWVRETWGVKTDWLNADDVATSYLVCYKADGRTQWKEVPISQRDKTQEQLLDDVDLLRTRWRPSIHMPRWASRITLEVTDVRVERVQEISQSDAYSEGVMATDLPARHIGPVSCFAALWDSIYSQRGFSWNTNPWVFVISFRRIS